MVDRKDFMYTQYLRWEQNETFRKMPTHTSSTFGFPEEKKATNLLFRTNCPIIAGEDTDSIKN
jgi:hypothetical protein